MRISSAGFIATPDNPPPAGAEALWLEGYDGSRLRAAITPSMGQRPRGTVIIFPGYSELIEKYFETATDMQQRGFVSFIMDWRGQGLSQRALKNPELYHLRNFDEPGRDIELALLALDYRLPRPWIILAHSMGSAIALRALTTSRVDAKAACFLSPMWGLQSANWLTITLANILRLIGLNHFPTTLKNGHSEEEVFSDNKVTSDPQRFTRNWDVWRTERGIRLYSPTIGWFLAAQSVIRRIRQKKNLERINIPITIISAGDERLVRNNSHSAIAALLPKAKHIEIADAKHELLQERDTFRSQTLNAFDALTSRAGI